MSSCFVARRPHQGLDPDAYLDLLGERAALAAPVAGPRLWMVLTGPWCGDPTRCLPCLTVLAGTIPSVELRMLPRDDNLDIMDQFLTDGKRSIPVLAAFDHEDTELFRWGPRPAAAQAVVDEAGAEGVAVLRRHLDGP